MGSKAAPSSFGRLAPTLLPEGHCCPFSSPAGACPGAGQSLPWGPLVACCPRETPRACEMSSGSRANQWVTCRRQDRGQGGLSSIPGPRTVSLGRWGPRDGLQGCTPLGEPTLGSSAAVPSLDHPCSRLDDSGPASRSGCAAAGPASPPSPLLSQHSRWRPGLLLPALLAGWLPPPVTFSSPAPEQVRTLLRGGPQLAQQHADRCLPQGEIGNLEGRRPHFTSSLSLTSALPLGQPRRPYFRRGDRSL